MIHAKLDAVTEAYLTALVTNAVREGRTIEYKAELPGTSDQSKKEFLADASSFANTSGGDLIYGVSEADGLPTGVPGVDVSTVDGETQRLDSMIRAGIEPRVKHLIRALPIADGKHVLIIRIDRSWIGPHRVVFGGHDKFYARNSAGKYPMDVGQLREAFGAAASLSDRFRAFRLDRLSKLATTPPLQLDSGPRIVVHCVPLLSLNEQASYDVNALLDRPQEIPLLGANYRSSRINLAGLLTYASTDTGTKSYTQIFRNGAMESVRIGLLYHRASDTGEEMRVIPHVAFEQELLKHVTRCCRVYLSMGVPPPIGIAVSLTGVRGYRMASDFTMDVMEHPGAPIDEDDVILPESIIENLTDSIPKLMKPTIDLLWNAAGHIDSPDFDAEGNWTNTRYPLQL
jgi:hypothetical protein